MTSETDRMNNALATLRSGLTEIRQQDVQLMRQLMNISSSIQQLTKEQKYTKRSKKTSIKDIIRISTLGKIDEDVSSSSSESDYESDSSSDVDIFRTNVKLWKYSHA